MRGEIHALTAFLLVLGSGFALLAAIGVVRLPDVYTRIQAATKASTLGAVAILLAVALADGGAEVVSRAGLVLVFLFVTSPAAAHAISRAAYRAGIAPWEGTAIDPDAKEFRGERSETAPPARRAPEEP